MLSAVLFGTNTLKDIEKILRGKQIKREYGEIEREGGREKNNLAANRSHFKVVHMEEPCLNAAFGIELVLAHWSF